MAKTAVASDVIQLAHRFSSEIIDEIHGRSYELCGIAAVVEKLADCHPPGVWANIICHLRSSLNQVSRELLVEIEALRDVEEGQ